jgi:capsid protein
MAELPFRVNDRRGLWTNGDLQYSEAVLNKGSRQRRQIADFNYDSSRLLTKYNRESLLSMGRWLFGNVTPLRNALSEMAMFASDGILQQFDGDDEVWGREAEAWLYDNDRICDVRGNAYGMDSLREMIVLSYLRDGDSFILLTESKDGWPMFQHIPGHRVGSRGMAIVPDGEYKGMQFQDGAIVDEIGRAIAYRILGSDVTKDRDVDTRSLIPCFIPEYVDQVRGTSPLAASILDFMDVGEARRLEMVSQKVFSGMSLLVHNETGGPAATANLVAQYGSGGTTSTGNASTDNVQMSADEIMPGVMQYARAGSGSKIEAITGDRPTMNQRAFTEDVLRQAIAGFGWSYDFSLNPTKVNGGPMRVVVDKINKRLQHIRGRLLYPVLRRMDGYRVAKAQKIGLLPQSDEWMKWEYISPARITADRKYDSDVAIAEYRAGFRTLADVCAANGEWAEDVLKRRKRETGEMLTAARELADAHGIDMSVAITLLRDTGNYSTITNSAAAVAQTAQEYKDPNQQ